MRKLLLWVVVFATLVTAVQGLCRVPADDLRVNVSESFCGGVYNIADGGSTGGVIGNVSHTIIDLNGSTLNGSGSGSGFTTSRTNVTIKNGAISNYANCYRFYGRNVTVINVTFTNCYGIFSDGSYAAPNGIGILVENSTFYNATWFINPAREAVFRNNTMNCPVNRGCGTGLKAYSIYVPNSVRLVMEGNVLSGNEMILFAGEIAAAGAPLFENFTIRYNTFKNADRAIALNNKNASNVTIANNFFFNNTNGYDSYYQAIELFNITKVSIENNTFSETDVPVDVQCSEDIIFKNNTFNITCTSNLQNEPCAAIKLGVYYKTWGYCYSHYNVSDNWDGHNRNIQVLGTKVNDSNVLILHMENAYNVTHDVPNAYERRWTWENFLFNVTIVGNTTFRNVVDRWKTPVSSHNSTALYLGYEICTSSNCDRRWYATDVKTYFMNTNFTTLRFNVSVNATVPFNDVYNSTTALVIANVSNYTFELRNRWEYIFGDYTLPEWVQTPLGFSVNRSQVWGVQYNVSDRDVVLNWSVNDTRFRINTTGYFTNATSLNVSYSIVNVSVADRSGNSISALVGVNVTLMNTSYVLNDTFSSETGCGQLDFWTGVSTGYSYKNNVTYRSAPSSCFITHSTSGSSYFYTTTNISNDMTASIWVYVTDTAFYNGAPSGSRGYGGLSGGSDANVSIVTRESLNFSYIFYPDIEDTPISVSYNRWYRFALTQSGNSFIGYINGVQVMNKTGLESSMSKVWIGMLSGWSCNFGFNINCGYVGFDDFLAWQGGLTDEPNFGYVASPVFERYNYSYSAWNVVNSTVGVGFVVNLTGWNRSVDNISVLMELNNSVYYPTFEVYNESAAYILNETFSFVSPLSKGNYSVWFNMTRSRGGNVIESWRLNGSDMNVVSLVTSDCSASSDFALNLSFFSEENPSVPVNVSYEYEFSLENAGITQTLLGNGTGKYGIMFCLTPSNVSSFADLYVRYDGGVVERYFDFNAELIGNVVRNVSAYVLSNSSGYCTLSVSVINNGGDYVPFSNVWTTLYRRYVSLGSYYAVQSVLTGTYGDAVFYVRNHDTDYKVYYRNPDSGDLYYNTPVMQFNCVDNAVSVQQLLSGVTTEVSTFGAFIGVNNDTRVLNVSWLDLNTSINHLVNIHVWKDSVLASVVVCDVNQSGALGYFACNSSLYDGVVHYSIKKNGLIVLQGLYDFGMDRFGRGLDRGDSAFFALTIFVTLVMVGASAVVAGPASGVVVVVFGCLSLVVLYALGLLGALTVAGLIAGIVGGIAVAFAVSRQ